MALTDTASESTASKVLTATAVLLAVLMVILDMTVVNVALPHMMGALGATPDQITWVLTSYIVAEAIIIPTSGFLAEEREEFDRWIRAGWVDTFRAFEPGEGHYSWWSQRFGVREKNIGWRIDYVLASPAAMAFVRGARIHADVRGSDHCPISVDLDRAVLLPPGATR